jgi:hypothetical protein
VGATGRIWYSGAPEPTDFDEEMPGHALLVEVRPQGITVEPRRVGSWRFVKRRFELARERDLEALREALAGLDQKERTVLRLALVGGISLRLAARLDGILAEARDLFAAVTEDRARGGLAVLPEDGDFEGLELAGFARSAAGRLRSLAVGDGGEAEAARGALALLVRLVEGAR